MHSCEYAARDRQAGVVFGLFVTEGARGLYEFVSLCVLPYIKTLNIAEKTGSDG